MRLMHFLRTLIQRAPAPGARKDPMPDPTPQPPAPQGAPDVAAHLAALAEAMRQLAESQKALVESTRPAPPQPAASSPTISGDPPGGVSPAALNAIDYSRLSPLQQITLGLRDTRPTPSARAGAD